MSQELTQKERLERLERALGETLYMVHSERGYPTLLRQAPHAAELLARVHGRYRAG